MTAARRGSRRLFRATALFFRQTDDDIAIAFAWAAHGRQLINRLAVDDKRIAAPVVAFRGIRQASRDCLGLGRNRNRDHSRLFSNWRASLVAMKKPLIGRVEFPHSVIGCLSPY